MAHEDVRLESAAEGAKADARRAATTMAAKAMDSHAPAIQKRSLAVAKVGASVVAAEGWL